jgi:GNAT superfamily N-acetyltransferase
MIEASEDFPHTLTYQYRRPGGCNVTFVAAAAGQILGMIDGTFDSDLDRKTFKGLHFPNPPHAFIVRMHVHESVRSRGIGTELMWWFADEAIERLCTYIGASIDLSSDPGPRRNFFRRCGFDVSPYDNIGGLPDTVRSLTARART